MDDVTPNDVTPATPAPVDPHADMWRTQADADLKAGKLTAEQHAGIMAELFGEQAPAPTQADPIAEHLTQIGFAPLQPKELRLREYLAGPDQNMTAEQRAAEGAITHWLLDSKLPAGVANHIVAEVAKNAPAWSAMDEGQREITARQARASLERLWGVQTDANIGLARELVRELDAKRPGLIRFLDESGAANSVPLIVNLSLHAERLKARDGKQ